MEHSIEKFKLDGKLYIWEFKERNPNMRWWNLTADERGCDFLCTLLQLMRHSNFPSRKRIRTVTPTEKQLSVPNNRNTSWKSKDFIDLKYYKSSSEYWKLTDKGESIEIEFDRDKIEEFQQAIEKVKAGKGDFAICDGNDGNILYFWWNVEK